MGLSVKTSLLPLTASIVKLASSLIHQQDLDDVLLSSYDYIICGCGISGLVTARRLSETDSVNVLCIEAGPADQYEAEVLFPVYVGNDVGGQYDWNLSTVAQSQLDGSPRPIPQGRVLGGGSILNGMVWHRAGADDFDAWNELGATGWAWADLLPYFMKSENYTPVTNQSEASTYSIQYNPTIHGYDGPVSVSYPQYIYPQSRNFYQALSSLDVPTAFDPNDGYSVGAAFTPQDLSEWNQTRSDARIAYYDPVSTRTNLHVLLNQHVTRVIFDQISNPAPQPPNQGETLGGETGEGPDSSQTGIGFQPELPVSGGTGPGAQRRQNSGLRAIGVEVSESLGGLRTIAYNRQYAANSSSPRQIIYATREVILAAGALHTTQILELSGIGPASLLEQYNISVAVNLPGVGNNLQDHCLVGTFYPYNNASYPLPTDLLTNASRNAQAMQEYLANKTGPYTAGAVDALAFLSLPSITNQSDSLIHEALLTNATSYLPAGMTDETLINGYLLQRQSLLSRLGTYATPAIEIINNNAGALTTSVMHPLSRGTCAIGSNDPFTPPVVDPRWLSDPTDRIIMTAALLFNREILATPAMQTLQPAQFVPSANASNADIQEIINDGVQTEFHVSGTAAMLPLELGGVVDTHCRVYGTTNLRVVDASIFPMLPGGHIQAIVYAVAEKASDIIKSDDAGVAPVSVPSSLSKMTTLPTPTSGSAPVAENGEVIAAQANSATAGQDEESLWPGQTRSNSSLLRKPKVSKRPSVKPQFIETAEMDATSNVLAPNIPGWSLNQKQMLVFLEDWARRTWGNCTPWECKDFEHSSGLASSGTRNE